MGVIVLAFSLVAGGAFAWAQSTTATPPMTNDDVIALCTARLSDDVVVTAIRTASQRRFDVSPSGLIALTRAGVPNAVIREMQKTNASVSAVPLSGVELELGSKKAHLISNSTDQKVFDEVRKQLREWNRWELVDAQDEADVLLVVSDKLTNYGPVGSFSGGTGTIVPVYSDQRFLILLDPTTNENILTISCERRLFSSHTAGVLVSRLRDRIVKDERDRKVR
jgi:hypothetical protein